MQVDARHESVCCHLHTRYSFDCTEDHCHIRQQQGLKASIKRTEGGCWCLKVSCMAGIMLESSQSTCYMFCVCLRDMTAWLSVSGHPYL